MNRIEFMTELAALLQDVPVEERKEAMQYYNDYFDDAGEEEKDVVKELGSPAKVAENIKKDLGIQTEISSGGAQNTGANHTGAQDARAQNNGTQNVGTQNVGTQEQSNHIWKIVLIVLVVIFGLPLLLGIGGGVLGLLAGIIATVFSVILTAVLVVVSGVLAVVSGIALSDRRTGGGTCVDWRRTDRRSVRSHRKCTFGEALHDCISGSRQMDYENVE